MQRRKAHDWASFRGCSIVPARPLRRGLTARPGATPDPARVHCSAGRRFRLLGVLLFRRRLRALPSLSLACSLVRLSGSGPGPDLVTGRGEFDCRSPPFVLTLTNVPQEDSSIYIYIYIYLVVWSSWRFLDLRKKKKTGSFFVCFDAGATYFRSTISTCKAALAFKVLCSQYFLYCCFLTP